MKRLIDQHLLAWKNSPYRQPLVLRGARQVGKTYSVRNLGNHYEHFVEINFERSPKLITLFEQDLAPERILRLLALELGLEKPINTETTLLFFDEVQAAPRAITALRYFYEEMPELHVIAAGSLLDFTLHYIGIPVGRVSFVYVYPLSFVEFLWATGNELLAQEIRNHNYAHPLEPIIHDKCLSLLGEYIAIGGMPAAVLRWIETHNLVECSNIHESIIETYRQDFDKYAKDSQLKYISLLFKQIPLFITQKFKFSTVSQEYRKRELAPCLELLVTAGIVHQVIQTSGNGLPIGADADLDDFKVLFIDIALTQTILGLRDIAWLTRPLEQFINKGQLVEAFIGQELLAHASPTKRASLYYWHREKRSSQAEVDYLIQVHDTIIPIEVKGGPGTTLRSMHAFLESHPQTPYGLRFSTQNSSEYTNIRSYPLYAVAALFRDSIH